MAQELIAAYGLPEGVGSDYWIKLLQDGIDSDAATVGEAAGLLDTLYDHDPCVDEEEPEGGEEPATDEEGKLEPPVTEEEYWQIVRELLDFSVCTDVDGCDLLYLRVYRSHLSEPYRLVIEGGEEQQKVVMAEAVKDTISVSGQNYADVDKPVHGGLRYSWRTARAAGGRSITPPSVTADGGKLVFSRSVTGLLLVQYQSTYDLVTIKVPRGADGQPAGCRVLALYVGTIAEQELRPPPVDESMDSADKEAACGPSGGVEVPGDKDYTCYERIYNRVLCSCSGDESGRSYWTERDVACPETWGEDVSPGRHLVGSRSVIAVYTDCGEGHGAVSEADIKQFEKICCHLGAPPACDTIYRLYQGGLAYDIDRARSEYGGNVVLVPVGPKEGACGKWTTKFRKPNLNCCEDVPPLTPDPSNPTEISPSGAVKLAVDGGNELTLDEWVWTASGGLTFANGLDEIHGGREQTVFAPEDLCEDNVVRVEDDCSSVSLPLANSLPNPLHIPADDLVAAPSSYFSVIAEGGVKPYNWSAGKSTLVAQHDNQAVFQAPNPPWCDTDTIYVSDACGDIAELVIRSTEGMWVPVPAEEYDACWPPGSPYPFAGAGVSESIKDGMKVTVSNQASLSGSCTQPAGFACAKGNDIIEGYLEATFCSAGAWSGGCCSNAGNYTAYTTLGTVWTWEC